MDSRLINYIVNDFNEMLQEYKKNAANKVTNIELIKLFALAIYKNFYYDDFNKLSKNEALLSKSFQLIQYIKNDKIKDI